MYLDTCQKKKRKQISYAWHKGISAIRVYRISHINEPISPFLLWGTRPRLAKQVLGFVSSFICFSLDPYGRIPSCLFEEICFLFFFWQVSKYIYAQNKLSFLLGSRRPNLLERLLEFSSLVHDNIRKGPFWIFNKILMKWN